MSYIDPSYFHTYDNIFNDGVLPESIIIKVIAGIFDEIDKNNVSKLLGGCTRADESAINGGRIDDLYGYGYEHVCENVVIKKINEIKESE